MTTHDALLPAALCNSKRSSISMGAAICFGWAPVQTTLYSLLIAELIHSELSRALPQKTGVPKTGGRRASNDKRNALEFSIGQPAPA
jgi:hypothetical protein